MTCYVLVLDDPGSKPRIIFPRPKLIQSVDAATDDVCLLYFIGYCGHRTPTHTHTHTIYSTSGRKNQCFECVFNGIFPLPPPPSPQPPPPKTVQHGGGDVLSLPPPNTIRLYLYNIYRCTRTVYTYNIIIYYFVPRHRTVHTAVSNRCVSRPCFAAPARAFLPYRLSRSLPSHPPNAYTETQNK